MSIGTIILIILIIALLGGFSGIGGGPFYGTGYYGAIDSRASAGRNVANSRSANSRTARVIRPSLRRTLSISATVLSPAPV